MQTLSSAMAERLPSLEPIVGDDCARASPFVNSAITETSSQVDPIIDDDWNGMQLLGIPDQDNIIPAQRTRSADTLRVCPNLENGIKSKKPEFAEHEALGTEDAQLVDHQSDSNNSQYGPSIREDTLSAPDVESSSANLDNTGSEQDVSAAIHILESAWQKHCNCG